MKKWKRFGENFTNHNETNIKQTKKIQPISVRASSITMASLEEAVALTGKETMDEMIARHKKELKDMQYQNRQRTKVVFV